MIKIDACSLIYLVKSDLLSLAEDLYKEIRITDSVYDEVVVQGKRAGYPDAAIAEAEVKRKQIKIVHSKSKKEPSLASLGRGESDTIAEARTEGCPALVDDSRAKIVARKLNVPFLSVDIMLIEALARKKITMEDFQKMARDLNSVANFRSDKYADLLAIATIVSRWKK
jgi:predicted nucleic acid-binding protein